MCSKSDERDTNDEKQDNWKYSIYFKREQEYAFKYSWNRLKCYTWRKRNERGLNFHVNGTNTNGSIL